MSETNPGYKNYYSIEVVFTDRDETGNKKGTVDIPYISSEDFFDIMRSKEMKNSIKEYQADAENPAAQQDFVMTLAQLIISKVSPGLLKTLTPLSGIAVMTKVFDEEKGTFGLGETIPPPQS